MTLLAVFLLSFCSLYYEIVLTRFFSLGQGNHLAFLVVGIAMLGSAAGGTAYGRARKAAGRFPFGPACLAMQASVPASLLGARLVPLDYLRFPVDAFQFVYLVIDLLILSPPFFICGLASCAAYDENPERSGVLSLASMAGSGAGALSPLFLFPLLGEGLSLVLVSAFLFVPAAFSGRFRRKGAGTRRSALPAVLSALCAACFFLAGAGGALDLPLSPYSALSQMRKLPGTREAETRLDIRGRVDVVESPSFRFAPGTGLGYEGSLPPSQVMTIDGDGVIALYARPEEGAADLARHSLSSLGWSLAPRPPRAALVLRNGGTSLVRALAYEAKDPVVVVEHPAAAAAIRARYDGLMECRCENARAFFATTDALFDIIEIEDWGSSLPGMESLAIGCHFTIDAFRSYWRRLSPDGAIVVPRRLLLPPQDILRLFSSAAKALSDEGIAEPEGRMAVARSWDASLLVVSRSPLEGSRLGSLRETAKERGFDLDWFPGIAPEDANLFNRFERPYHFEALRELVANPSFAHDYPMDIAAQSDDRPFPSKFLKWTRVSEFFASTGGRPYVLLLSGEAASVGILCAAFAVAAPLVLVPLIAGGKRRRGGRARALLLFASSGAGFLLAEIAFMDGFALLWGNPSLCLVVILSCMLAFSGAGGIVSRKCGLRGFRTALALAAAAMAAAAFLLRPGATLALGLPPAARIAFAAAFLAIPSFLAGVSFPAAMRLLPADGAERGLYWAVNGAASVIASILAVPIVISLGIRALALCSAAAYCVAAFCAKRYR